jgi:large subunit ribosomal protein L1
MGQTRTKVVETAVDPDKLKKLEELEKKPAAKTEVAEKKEKTRPPKVRSKRYKGLLDLIDKSKVYPATEAVEILQKTANAKFDSSFEAHVNLGLSAEKSEHQIRTLVSLPHKVGKKIKILIFTNKSKEEIKKLGAEIGTETSLKEIGKGKVDYDKIIADSTWMPKLAKVAKVLGPKGLMPNPKSGTVTEEPLKTVKEFSGGKVELKTEKFPIIHVQIGGAGFKPSQIKENLETVMSAINEAKPEGFKKALIKSIYISSTMGPSIKVDPISIGKEEDKA